MIFEMLEYFGPVLSVLGTITKIEGLISKGFHPKFQDLFLPSLIITFLPQIITNGFYHNYELNPMSILYYFIGFALSLFAYRNHFFISFIKEFLFIVSGFNAIKTVQDPELTGKKIMWGIICEFNTIIIKKTLFRKKLKIKFDELLPIFVVNGGFYIIKTYKLPEFLAVAVVTIIPLYNRIKSFVSSREELDERIKNHQTGVLNTPKTKMPRRKASVANLLEQKNK